MLMPHAVGILNLFTAVSVSRGSSYPRYHLLIQGMLPGFL